VPRKPIIEYHAWLIQAIERRTFLENRNEWDLCYLCQFKYTRKTSICIKRFKERRLIRQSNEKRQTDISSRTSLFIQVFICEAHSHDNHHQNNKRCNGFIYTQDAMQSLLFYANHSLTQEDWIWLTVRQREAFTSTALDWVSKTCLPISICQDQVWYTQFYLKWQQFRGQVYLFS